MTTTVMSASDASLENSKNLALSATATASSETEFGLAANVNDGVVGGVVEGGIPNVPSNEWVSDGESNGAWVKLTWDTPQEISQVVLYDRLNTLDQLTGGVLVFSDGSFMRFNGLKNTGAAKSLAFDTKTVDSVTVQLTVVSKKTIAAGLAEIAVYGPE